MDTFSGITSLPFSPPFEWVSSLLGKNLLPQEQILSFKSIPLLSRASSYKEPNTKPEKLFPFEKIVEKVEEVCLITEEI